MATQHLYKIYRSPVRFVLQMYSGFIELNYIAAYICSVYHTSMLCFKFTTYSRSCIQYCEVKLIRDCACLFLAMNVQKLSCLFVQITSLTPSIYNGGLKLFKLITPA